MRKRAALHEERSREVSLPKTILVTGCAGFCQGATKGAARILTGYVRFSLRKGMITADQKKRLALLKDDIIRWSEEKNFQGALKNLLPANYQPLLTDFHRALRDELERT